MYTKLLPPIYRVLLDLKDPPALAERGDRVDLMDYLVQVDRMDKTEHQDVTESPEHLGCL